MWAKTKWLGFQEDEYHHTSGNESREAEKDGHPQFAADGELSDICCHCHNAFDHCWVGWLRKSYKMYVFVFICGPYIELRLMLILGKAAGWS